MHRLFALAVFLSSLSGWGQSLSGHWLLPEKTLYNGDTPTSILDLQQNGTQLTATVLKHGWSMDLVGQVNGNRVMLATPSSISGSFLNAELKKGMIEGQSEGRSVTLRRATAVDETLPARIAPPPIHPLKGNGLALAPPMGWNSWNLFHQRIDDKTVREIADAMVSSGMRDAGYVYVNIDDTWEGQRDQHGTLQPNPKFPDMKALADYLHARGLKLGIYSSPGPYTCADYPGSYGHEMEDARQFAAWGVDYLKYDWCSARRLYSDVDLQGVYQRMGEALRSTGRPIVFSLCEYGLHDVATWGPKVGGNLWRTTEDIRDNWPNMIANIEAQATLAEYSGPGHWNDPDMLEVGNGHMTTEEYRTHMGLWALNAAPLLAGNDLRNMAAETKAILMNRNVIAIDQDLLGKQAIRSVVGNLEIWKKPLLNGSAAVGILNRADKPVTANFPMDSLQSSARSFENVWNSEPVKIRDGKLTAEIPAHGLLLLRSR